MSAIEEQRSVFEEAAEQVIELGNQLQDFDDGSDVWEVATGMLAGAIQFWLFSRQPCDDPFCEACAEIATAERRLQVLMKEARELAADSDYFESPHDHTVGNA